MDAPQSKKFKALRRQNTALTGEAVKASIQGRRAGFLGWIFRLGGKKYKGVAVNQTQPALVPEARNEQ
ncbi:MAG: hypothetical protein AAFN92_06430 [Bacteroidota bacterium]